MSATVRGGTVLPHVQAFADALEAAGLALSFGTYNGHQPARDRALDIFVPATNRTQGDRVCDFALGHLKQYGIDYVIFRQRIYNPKVSPSWRPMADRGNPTANHVDHVHVSFEATAVVTPNPSTPQPPKEDIDMLIASLDGAAWLVTGSIRTYIDLPEELERLKGAGVREVPGDSHWLRQIPEGVTQP